MMDKFAFKDGIDGDRQMGSYQNGTQTTIGDNKSITIGVTPSFPGHVDTSDASAVEAYMREMFQPLVAAGFDIEIQYGPMDRDD